MCGAGFILLMLLMLLSLLILEGSCCEDVSRDYLLCMEGGISDKVTWMAKIAVVKVSSFLEISI